jgi:hypothetical protein
VHRSPLRTAFDLLPRSALDDDGVDDRGACVELAAPRRLPRLECGVRMPTAGRAPRGGRARIRRRRRARLGDVSRR